MDGQNLSGQLSDWSINDLLQIMQVTNKTGSLDISGDRKGRVHFRDGTVTAAELSGAKGTYRGTDKGAVADILYVLSTVKSGTFSVGPADGPDTEGHSVEEITAELDALRSLEGEVVDAGLFEAPYLRLVREVDVPVVFEPSDWVAMCALVKPFTFDYLESQVGRGTAVRIFHTLHRLGVAEGVSGDDESDWLDRVAGAVSKGTGTPWFAITDEAAAKHVAAPQGEPETEAAEPERELEPAAELAAEPVEASETPASEPRLTPAEMKGVSAPASTTLTDGVYDEIRRLRSKVAER